MTNLFTKLAQLEVKLSTIESDKLGVPQRKRLLARKSIYNPTTKVTTIEDTLISPKVFLTSVSPKYINLQVAIEGSNTINISINDIQVEIPRTYPKEFFTNRIKFVIEPPLKEDGTVDYSNLSTKQLLNADWYNLRVIDDRSSIVWTLILSKELDKKQ